MFVDVFIGVWKENGLLKAASMDLIRMLYTYPFSGDISMIILSSSK